MTISNHIKSQYFANEEQLIRLAPSQPLPLQPTKRKGTPWTDEEHNRFLEALEQHPAGPWKLIAEHVATRTTRQTMTHAQRYREKIARRRRMLAESGLPTLSTKDEPSSSSTEVATTSQASASSAATAATQAALSQARFDDGNSESDDDGDADIDDDNQDIDTTIVSGDSAAMSQHGVDLSNMEFEDVQDDELLLSLVDAYDPRLHPFSEEDARWLAEHYSSNSLEGGSGTANPF